MCRAKQKCGLVFCRKIRKIAKMAQSIKSRKKIFLSASDMQTTDSSFYSQMTEKRLRFDVQHVLLLLKVVVTVRGERIVCCGAEEGDVAAPRAHDESFCG